MTRKEEVLYYMNKYGSITHLEAIKTFWNWRLSGTIYNLRKEGYEIDAENVVVTRANGEKSIVTRYSFTENKDSLEKAVNRCQRIIDKLDEIYDENVVEGI